MSCIAALKSSFLPAAISYKEAAVLSLLNSAATSTRLPLNRQKPFGASASKDKNNVCGDADIISTGDQSTSSNAAHATKTLNFSGQKPTTPILDTINFPIHMKNLSIEELEKLANELREEVVYTVSKTGGHLSSSLGVAELTVSLHHVFNAPDDKIIWDVGHQTYPHKILTGRRGRMHTMRQTCGLAGFPKREESIYDAFGAGHSSTSISAGLGTFGSIETNALLGFFLSVSDLVNV